MFGLSPVERLSRKLRAVTEERDAFKNLATENSQTVWNLQQEALAAKANAAQPANLTEVTLALKALLPSIAYAPGYSTLTSAADPKSYAQALNLLLQHARLVGRAEVQPR